MAAASVQTGERLLGETFFTFVTFGEEFLLDMTIESVLDHVFGSVGEELLDHLPLSTVLTVHLDDGGVLLGGESATPDFFVELGFEALLDSLGRDQWVIEYFGYFRPVLAKFFNIF